MQQPLETAQPIRLGSRKPAVIAVAATVGVVAVAIGITASQSASAAAANPSATPSGRPTGAPGTPGGPGDSSVRPGGWGAPVGPGGHRGPGGPGGFGSGGQLLHGEEFVQQGTKVVTIEEQAGQVTAVSATSITVRARTATPRRTSWHRRPRSARTAREPRSRRSRSATPYPWKGRSPDPP